MPGNLYPGTFSLSSRKLSQLDRDTSQLVNFDDGGLYAPSGQIVIGGKGVSLNASSDMIGPVITRPGYGSNDPRIELTDQWPVFSGTRTKTVSVSWLGADGSGAQPIFYNTNGSCVRTGLAGSGINIGMALNDHRLHQGSYLIRATCSYRYTVSKPTAIPGSTELFNIARFDRSTGGLSGAMHTAGTSGSTTYTSIGAYRVVANVDEWYANGNVVSIVYEPNQNNLIDKATYYYGFGLFTPVDAEAIGIKLEFYVSDQRFE
jgi:hypothetical protein